MKESEIKSPSEACVDIKNTIQKAMTEKGISYEDVLESIENDK